MTQEEEIRERFPGIEFKDGIGYHGGMSRVCSTYQTEDHILDCMKYTLEGVDGKCSRLVLRYGETWFSCDTYFNRDDAISALFKDSLSKYITRFSISRGLPGSDDFEMRIKVHELGGPVVETNIGPNLLEYIAGLFAN